MTFRARVTRLSERLANPIIRTAVRLGIAPRAFALIETTGRRSGLPRRTPVGNGLDGDVFWIVSEHGERAGYVKNLIAKPTVRVKVPRRRWRTGTATIVPNDDGIARRRELDRANGLVGRFDGVIFRASADDVCTIRVDLDPT